MDVVECRLDMGSAMSKDGVYILSCSRSMIQMSRVTHAFRHFREFHYIERPRTDLQPSQKQ